MDIHALRRVCVWLDELAPECGSFAHALEWASELDLPLQAVSEALTQPIAGHRSDSDLLAKKLASCALACTHRGVAWEEPVQGGIGLDRMDRLFGLHSLGVFGAQLPLPLKEKLLFGSLRSAERPILMASTAWQPISRVLVLHEWYVGGDDFLDSVTALCRTIHAAPIVLTVSSAEAKARQGQERAQEIMAQHRLDADFDLLVGGDLPVGIAAVARWRQCSHVFVAQRRATPWWHWFRRGIMGHLLRLPDSLTVLALPPAAAPAPAPAGRERLELAHTPRK
jgi:hypothetical protein